MKIDEIEAAVQTYREQRTAAMHNRINATGRRWQTEEFIGNEAQAVDEAVAAYRVLLGEPDAQSIAQEPDVPQDEPAPAGVTPGVKNA